MVKWLVRLAVLSVFVALSGWLAVTAYADSLSSPHYQFIETDLGGGGLIQSSSPNYKSSESIGDSVAGNSASGNYQTEAGGKTTNDPALTFIVNSGGGDFGSFSPSIAATANSTFSVSNYTSYGYVVQIAGTAPTSGSHTITPMASNAGSLPGTEQFGINLVANTSPTSFGSNPVQSLFGAGVAATNYNTPNSYRYVSGETIATAPKSSGVTTYTISYIVNVTSLTPGGQYTSNQVLVCTATF